MAPDLSHYTSCTLVLDCVMTMPRWWDDRLKFGLALAFLAMNVGLHLILLSRPALATGWSWLVLLYSLAFLVFHLITARSRRPFSSPAKPTPTWREQAVQFMQMPLWAQGIRLLYNALILYVLLLLVLGLANLFVHWSDGSLYNLLLWTALCSVLSLDRAFTAAKALGWWGRWQPRS
jgi:hypothetical protein